MRGWQWLESFVLLIFSVVQVTAADAVAPYTVEVKHLLDMN